jgi:branched-chain amino acid transport system substrate-binding protein
MTSPTLSRRRVLQATGATGAVALAGCIGGGGGDDQGDTTDGDDSSTIRIGVVQNLDVTTNTGWGSQTIAGLLSGFAYKNEQDTPVSIPSDDEVLSIDGETIEYTIDSAEGVDTIDLELLIRHTGGDADEAANLSAELIEEKGVDILYGASTSAALRQINNLVLSSYDVPFFVGQGSTANITRDAESCREHVFRAPPNGAMLARAGALYISEATDIERVTILSANTSFGRDVRRNYRRILEPDSDVTIAMDEQVERGFAEGWDEILLQANDVSEAILYGFTGDTGEFFADGLSNVFANNLGEFTIKAYGQTPSRLTLQDIGQSLLQTPLADGPEDITQDLLDALPFGEAFSRYHWNQYDNEINKWLVDAHTDVYNIVPDLFTGSSFTTASAIVQAFQQAGEQSSEAVVNQVNGMAVSDTPKGSGEYVFQEFNNQAISPITVAGYAPTEDRWADQWPAIIQPGDPETIGGQNFVSKERAALPQDDDSVTCDLS